MLSPKFCCILFLFLYLNSVNKDDDDDDDEDDDGGGGGGGGDDDDEDDEDDDDDDGGGGGGGGGGDDDDDDDDDDNDEDDDDGGGDDGDGYYYYICMINYFCHNYQNSCMLIGILLPYRKIKPIANIQNRSSQQHPQVNIQWVALKKNILFCSILKVNYASFTPSISTQLNTNRSIGFGNQT